MNPETVAAQIAIRTLANCAAFGLVSAHYPMPGIAPECPSLVVYLDANPVQYTTDAQFHTMSIIAHLCMPLEKITESIGILDALVTRVIDTWDPNFHKDNYLMAGSGPGNGAGVEGCAVTNVRYRRVVVLNNVQHFAHELTFTAGLRREAVS